MRKQTAKRETVNVNVQLPKPMNSEVEKIAQDRLTTKSAVIREILLNHIRANDPANKKAA